MEITDEELASVNRAILTRYGMDFSNYEPISFKRRVARVIDKFKLENSIGLWRKLLADPNFIFSFVDEITVGLTEMFRNPEFWIKMRADILPMFKGKPVLNIWHAGCSTGEEVYSMAILLSEENYIHKVKALAVDLNSQSVKNASEGKFSTIYTGTYSKNYVAAGGKKTLDAYYTIDGDMMHFNKVNKGYIDFKQFNLVKDNVIQKFDIILCRNVMIYFDEKLKMKVLELFHQSLNDSGIFIIGYYDALPGDYKKYFELYDPQTKIYKKLSR